MQRVMMFWTCSFGFLIALAQVGGCCSDSEHDSGEDTRDTTQAELSADSPNPGVYALVLDATEFEPASCRLSPAGDGPTWSLDLSEIPAHDGTFSAVETFAGHPGEYACDLAGGVLGCERETVVDYGEFSELDARVAYVATFEVTLEAGILIGEFSNEVVCEGDGCEFVVQDWSVQGFPCASSGELTATIEG